LIFAAPILRLTNPVQLELLFGPARSTDPAGDWLLIGPRRLPLCVVRNRLARRYILRLTRQGTARVTIPRGGTKAEGKQFALKHASWLEKQLLRQAKTAPRPKTWEIGTEIYFRGQPVALETANNGQNLAVRFGTETVRIPHAATDLRPSIERHLWRLAARELPLRISELAAAHQVKFQRVTVRNQRSRWGSCSRRGTISLNWRLIQ